MPRRRLAVDDRASTLPTAVDARERRDRRCAGSSNSACTLPMWPRWPVTYRSSCSARPDLGCAPFQTRAVVSGWPAAVDALRLVEVEAVVEQRCARVLARLHRVGAEHHRDQPHAVALRRGDQAVARGLGVAGLDAVHRRVAPQQPVAVLLRDAVPGEFLLRVPLVVLAGTRGSARAASVAASRAVM